MRRRLIFLLACAACGSGDPNPAVISDDTWVAAIADLREADRHAGDNVGAYLAAREQVLREHGVTEQDLRDYVAAHAAELQHLADVWARAHDAAGAPDAR